MLPVAAAWRCFVGLARCPVLAKDGGWNSATVPDGQAVPLRPRAHGSRINVVAVPVVVCGSYLCWLSWWLGSFGREAEQPSRKGRVIREAFVHWSC